VLYSNFGFYLLAMDLSAAGKQNILQKAGGLQGTFTYIAFAPARNAAVFTAIDKFDFGAAFAMGQFANELLEQIAPR